MMAHLDVVAGQALWSKAAEAKLLQAALEEAADAPIPQSTEPMQANLLSEVSSFCTAKLQQIICKCPF